MTPAIYTIMMRFNFRRTNTDSIKQLSHSAHPSHPALVATPKPVGHRRIFDGIHNIMQLKQSGMCGSCK